ncbi:glycine--tRNA ligase subunit beta, partial [Pseudoalteromonas ruthenica]
VHTVAALLGGEIVQGEVLGKVISNQLQGHRFHHPERVSINHADDAFDTLKGAYVIADYEARKALIREQINAEADKL